jgi:DNA mismatch repair protein MutS2
MDNQPFKALEFDQILELLKGFATSSVGKALCGSLKPQRKLSWIKKRLGEVDDLKNIMEVYGEIPLGGIKDIREAIERAKIEGSVLSTEEILDILGNIRVSLGLKSSFKKVKGDFPLFEDLISRLSDLRGLVSEIVRTIDRRGKIFDHASSALRQIRIDIAGYRKRIKSSLEEMMRREDLQTLFQEKLITIRNGRYVLPIKSEFKSQMEGIVHDHSHSKMTIFLEPMDVVDYNNELSMFLEDERQEERRILSELTRRIGEFHQELLRDLEILGEVDLLYAKVKLSQKLGGINPLLNRNGVARLLGVRHPLLYLREADRTVPIDIYLSGYSKVLIISGANTGGKTVALKTIGLLSLMAQSGMHIPATEGSEIPLYYSIFADIGDEQNIRENLSTFSAHILSLIRIMEKSDEFSLILLDELGVGTNSKEGSALAIGVLDYLIDKGATVVVTTHLDELKAYGYLNKGATNVSVAFDSKTLEPRYELIYGDSGSSNAFLVAEKLGFPKVVLDLATRYISQQESGVSRFIRNIEGLQDNLKKEHEEIVVLKEEIQGHRDRVRELVGRIKERRQQILQEAQDRGRAILQQTEIELKRIAEEVTRGGERRARIPKGDLKKVRERFFLQFRSRGRKGGDVAGLRKGDWVRVLSLNRIGIVSEVYGEANKADVRVENMKVHVPLGDLERTAPQLLAHDTRNEGLQYEAAVEKAVQSEINVVGLTVEEALPVVDKFIDDAILSRLEKVDIIHGRGTGRLREAIGNHLKHHRNVKRFGSKDIMRSGVTVVEFC